MNLPPTFCITKSGPTTRTLKLNVPIPIDLIQVLLAALPGLIAPHEKVIPCSEQINSHTYQFEFANSLFDTDTTNDLIATEVITFFHENNMEILYLNSRSVNTFQSNKDTMYISWSDNKLTLECNFQIPEYFEESVLTVKGIKCGRMLDDYTVELTRFNVAFSEERILQDVLEDLLPLVPIVLTKPKWI